MLLQNDLDQHVPPQKILTQCTMFPLEPCAYAHLRLLLRPRDDRLDDRDAIFTLALAGGVEGDRRVIEVEPMSDQRLQVNLALRDETNGQGRVARLWGKSAP